MGWGEAHAAGNGTTGQVEEAHRALDALGVAPGPLALRTIALSAQLHDAADELVRLRVVLDGLQLRVERLEHPTAALLADLIADADRRVLAELDNALPPGTTITFDTSPLVCIATEVVDGAAPNAVWCGVHACFHPYRGSAPANTGTAG